MALRAKLYFERHIIFEISRSEISKMMCLSKQYSAAEGGKNLFTQPHILLKPTSVSNLNLALELPPALAGGPILIWTFTRQGLN